MTGPESPAGRSATATIDGIPVHYAEHGRGRPVLVIHGWAVDHRAMTGVLEPLFASRDGYRRLYVDLPGMGSTPAPETIASSDDLLDVVLGFVETVIEDQPFLLVGQSHGGYLARAVADRLTGRVAGLALICPLGDETMGGGAELPAHMVLHRSGDIAGIVDGELAGEVEGYLVVQTPEILRRFQEREGPGVAAADKPALERIYERFTLSTKLGGVEVAAPALIVTGRQDSFVGYAGSFGWLADYPRATCVVLDRAGHALPHEQPELLAHLLSEWLDRVEEHRVASAAQS